MGSPTGSPASNPAGSPQTVCVPRAVLFGALRLSEVRAYALLLEAADEGISAAELDAALGLGNRGNARKVLAALSKAGLASVTAPAPARTGRGAAKRWRPAAAAPLPEAAGDSVPDPVPDPVPDSVPEASVGPAGAVPEEAVPGPGPEGIAEGVARRPPGAGRAPRAGNSDGNSTGAGRVKGASKKPKAYDPVTEDCMRLLAQLPDFPDNRTNVARKLLEYQCKFRGVDPIKACVEYVDFHDGKPEGFTENHLARLHRFFANREKWGQERGGSGEAPAGPSRDGSREEARRRGEERRREGYEWLFGEDDANGREEEAAGPPPPIPESDPEAERLKEDLVACVSEHDGRNRGPLFSSFVPVGVSGGRLTLVCPNEEFPPYVRDRWGELLLERNVVVMGAAEYAAEPAGRIAAGAGRDLR